MSRADVLLGAIVGDVRRSAARPRRATLSPTLSGTYSRYFTRDGLPQHAMISGGGCRSNQRSAGAAYSSRSRSFHRAAAAATSD